MSDATSAFMLQVNEHNLPAVRAAVEESLNELGDLLLRATNEAYIPEPWMGDHVSRQTRTVFNNHATSAVAAMTAYQAELSSILEQLVAMEKNYQATEGANAAQMRHQA